MLYIIHFKIYIIYIYTIYYILCMIYVVLCINYYIYILYIQSYIIHYVLYNTHKSCTHMQYHIYIYTRRITHIIQIKLELSPHRIYECIWQCHLIWPPFLIRVPHPNPNRRRRCSTRPGRCTRVTWHGSFSSIETGDLKSYNG